MSETPEKLCAVRRSGAALLTPEQYRVLREKGTERPFTGVLTENHETGNYHCAGCGALLFHERGQVRLRLRVAELHAAGRFEGDCRARGPQLRHAAD